MDESWQTEADEYMAVIDDPAAPWDARVRASESASTLWPVLTRCGMAESVDP